MPYDVSTNKLGRTEAVLSPAEPPEISDYDLTDARLESAKNGVIVTCEHKLKPDVERKMKGKEGKNYVDYEVRNRSTKHVFNDRGEATEFLASRLMGKESKPKVETSPKMKVRKV